MRFLPLVGALAALGMLAHVQRVARHWTRPGQPPDAGVVAHIHTER